MVDNVVNHVVDYVVQITMDSKYRNSSIFLCDSVCISSTWSTVVNHVVDYMVDHVVDQQNRGDFF